jgi:hypothetical protein
MTEPKVNHDEIARLMGSELGRGRIIAFPDCALCDGSGQVMGGDEYQQCSDCRLRARRNGAADALAIGAALLTPPPTDAEWYAEAEGDPLWARFIEEHPNALDAWNADANR